MRITFSTAIGGLVICLMAVVLVWGADLIGGPSALKVPDESFLTTPEVLGVLLVATDHAVNMLTTLSLGLVVLAGFCFRVGEDRGRVTDLRDRLAGAGLVVFLFTSIFFGFAARRLAFDFTSTGYSDWRYVQTAINAQAVFLGVVAIFGFYLVARSLERAPGTPSVKSRARRRVDIDNGPPAQVSRPTATLRSGKARTAALKSK